MHSFTLPAIALAAIAAIPTVSAHGYVSGVVTGGKWSVGGSPQWKYDTTKPQQAGWFADNQDLGFVSPDSYTNADIICHKSATPGTTYINAVAGSKVDLQWTTWPSSHHGPVITYLARCAGECTTATKADLSFFKIDASGLIDDTTVPGTWATDKMIANNNTYSVTIPADIAPGNFVMRHEIIALHSAGTANGAQSYPNCLNFKITGSGTKKPCAAGADCRKGTALYSETGAGIVVNIYTTLASYSMPGPAIWTGLAKRVAMAFTA